MVNFFKDYRISSPYGWRTNPFKEGGKEFHQGIDLVKGHKTLIYPFVEGIVVHAGEGKKGTGLGGYGNVVAIRDKKGCLHLYAHLDSVQIRSGIKARKHIPIGRQGSTGRSTGSHLHYEIRKKASPAFGWSSDTDSYCHEPTKYLEEYYKEIAKPITESKPIPESSSSIKVIGKIKIVNVEKVTTIYSKPSSKGEKIGLALLGRIFPIAGSVPGWWEIIYKEKRAYIKALYGKKV